MNISYWSYPSLPITDRPKYQIAKHYIKCVCEKLDVDFRLITSKSRKKEIVYARHISAFFLYHLTSCSLKDVAFFLGKINHTTICNSLSICKKILDNDKGYPYYDEFVELASLICNDIPIDTLKKIKKRGQWNQEKGCKINI